MYRKDLAAAAPIYTPLLRSNRGTRLSYDALHYQWAQACASAGLADDHGDPSSTQGDAELAETQARAALERS